MSKYSQLRKLCKLGKIKVKEVPTKRVRDYAAMNDEAAKKMGYPKMRDKSIIIDRNLKSDTKYRTLKHELVEMDLMEKKHMKYWPAHLKALAAEKRKWKI